MGNKDLSLMILSLFGITILTGGCASMRMHSHHESRSDGGPVGQVIRHSDAVSHYAVSSPTPIYIVEEEVLGMKLRKNRFDYPVVVTPSVIKWIHYFNEKGRKYFEQYLARSRYFIPEISKVLKFNKMPQDLVYLAMIESGFYNSAKSRARAVGPWQFIKQTGQRYGLTIDYWLDERRDTRKSTQAAIGYLKELYQEFGTWELAAAAYNAGENKVRRAIDRFHTNNFWEIAKHRFLKRETRDYVPKIMAAAIITKNPELFGFENPFNKGAQPITNPTTSVLVDSKEESIGGSLEEPTPKELGEETGKAEEPTEDVADTNENTNEEESQNVASLHTHTPVMTPSLYMVANPDEHIVEYEVKGPIDLFSVTKASGLPYSTVKLLNPELLRWCTPPYMTSYHIKLPASVKNRFLANYNDENFDRRVVFLHYIVRRGDSVRSLARRFRIEADPIREINHIIAKTDYLPIGHSIALPLPTGSKRILANMYDEKPMPIRHRRHHLRHHRHRHIPQTSASASQHLRLKPNVATVSDQG